MTTSAEVKRPTSNSGADSSITESRLRHYGIVICYPRMEHTMILGGRYDAMVEGHDEDELAAAPRVVVLAGPPQPQQQTEEPEAPDIEYTMDRILVRTERAYLRQPELGEDVYVGRGGHKYKLMLNRAGKYYMHDLTRQARPTGTKPVPMMTPFEMARHAINQRNEQLGSALATELLAAETEKATDPLPPSEPVVVQSLDVSGWTEFGDFFERPSIKSTLHMFDVRVADRAVLPCRRIADDCWDSSFVIDSEKDEDGKYLRMVIPVSYLSVFASNREDAIKALRRDLLKIHQNPDLTVHAFLARPSTCGVFDRPGEDEIPDSVCHFGLTVDPDPAVQGYVARCYLVVTGQFANDAEEREYYDTAAPYYKGTHICHGIRPLGPPSEFEAYTGIKIARQEGQIGVRDADL